MKTTADILILGGGVIGLAIALELKLQGASVAILCRQFEEAASQAAAGMLAPQAEGIPSGAMRELCIRSRDLYPGWSQKLEAISGYATDYWPCGILAPAYCQADFSHDVTQWQAASMIHERQSHLSDEVIGGWWFPEDAQVDSRKLARSLWLAVQELGVTIYPGVAVQEVVRQIDRVTHLRTSHGDYQAAHYILATGAWSQDLLQIPVVPRKGQMMAVRVPDPTQLPLQTVLFGSESYIVPRQDGRIVIGATSENVGFLPGNTPAGMQQLMGRATRLVPEIANYTIEEFWYGYRPATPDELPFLGASPYENLTLATGHYRNGILLTPITGQIVANWVLHQEADALLPAFHWSRFTA
ncbi:glycine oxidase ThiO [Alkalinema pantanalense CENA528]|uniref:glycine oxidase ThiO n=1 Tax=Alkalinema pantanalense TaxID=1620705 RepID=UPI003D701766